MFGSNSENQLVAFASGYYAQQLRIGTGLAGGLIDARGLGTAIADDVSQTYQIASEEGITHAAAHVTGVRHLVGYAHGVNMDTGEAFASEEERSAYLYEGLARLGGALISAGGAGKLADALVKRAGRRSVAQGIDADAPSSVVITLDEAVSAIGHNADVATELARRAAARGRITPTPQSFGTRAHTYFERLNKRLNRRFTDEGSTFRIFTEEFRDVLGNIVSRRASGSIGQMRFFVA